MLNINAFWSVIHEMKIFEDFSKFTLCCPLVGPKGSQTPFVTDLNPHLPRVILPSLVEIGQVVLEKKIFKHFPTYYCVKL